MIRSHLATGTSADCAPCDFMQELGCVPSVCLITQECYYHFAERLCRYNRTMTRWEARFRENFPPPRERANTRSFPEFHYPNNKDLFRGKRDFEVKTQKWIRRYGWEIEEFQFVEQSHGM